MGENIANINQKLDRRLAILKTDIFIDASSSQDNITQLLENFFANSGYELNYYDVINNQFPNPRSYSAFLITGSKHSVYEPLSWIRNLEDFINNNNLPKLIGICFGHQLIAQARGGIVTKGDWNVGVKPVTFYSSGEHTYNMRFNHQDYVTMLPSNTALLASSNECEHAMYQQGAHTLGMQFHPEFTIDHHTKVVERINNHSGFSPMQYEVFRKDIQLEDNTQKALEVIKSFLKL